MSEANERKLIKPLGRVCPIWERDISEYPDTLKVPMDDGHVLTYRLELDMPHPNCKKAIDIIKIMKRHTYGGYSPRRNKK